MREKEGMRKRGEEERKKERPALEDGGEADTETEGEGQQEGGHH